jgi:hypothetical protein
MELPGGPAAIAAILWPLVEAGSHRALLVMKCARGNVADMAWEREPQLSIRITLITARNEEVVAALDDYPAASHYRSPRPHLHGER